ncbi:MAG: BrnA antitoxin family protein [Deltaproteobacteria bacterium]|nr:BrnA antitoxin family protein [Deltaproteobacteria bacterium]MDA8306594.1 BrnA antitoxin family protein [Deltaproteobacteria bacterium]
MKDHYDFSKGRRGPIVPPQHGKTKITIRIDADILEWFRNKVDTAGGGSYQTMMNAALRQYIETQEGVLEATIRRVIREELKGGRQQ